MKPSVALLLGLLSGCCQAESGFSHGTDAGTAYASASIAFSAGTRPPPAPLPAASSSAAPARP